MKTKNKLLSNRLLFVLRTVALSCATMFASAHAEDQSTSADTNAPTPAQRALALLKPATDKLSSAKAFTFKAHNMVEVPSPVGQTINYFFVTDVAVQRPNKLKSKKSGDGNAFDLYYNSKQFTGVDEKLKLFAQMDAP